MVMNYYKHPMYTNYGPHFAWTLDYIFFRHSLPGQSRGQVELVSLLEMPSVGQIQEGNGMTGCPTLNLPSDHFRCEAVFRVGA